MKTVQLTNSTLYASRFIFGTAKLFSLTSQSNRRRLIELAIEHGFTHFDSAPLYGFGIAESDLGFVLKRHPNVGISTKVGLYSPGGEFQSPTKVFLRKSGGRLFNNLSCARVDFSLQRAKKSLEASLQRLKREQVELLLIHEPEPDLLGTDEWLAWLQECKKTGKILEFGVAGEIERIIPLLRQAPGIAPIIQTLDTLHSEYLSSFKTVNRAPQITYGYFSSAKESAAALSYREVLVRAQKRNRDGAIIVSTGKPSHFSLFSELSDAEK